MYLAEGQLSSSVASHTCTAGKSIEQLAFSLYTTTKRLFCQPQLTFFQKWQ